MHQVKIRFMFPNLKIEQSAKIQKNCLLDAGWHTNFPRASRKFKLLFGELVSSVRSREFIVPGET